MGTTGRYAVSRDSGHCPPSGSRCQRNNTYCNITARLLLTSICPCCTVNFCELQVKRAKKFLDILFEHAPEKVVVVVTHSGFTRSLLLAVQREPYRYGAAAAAASHMRLMRLPYNLPG